MMADAVMVWVLRPTFSAAATADANADWKDGVCAVARDTPVIVCDTGTAVDGNDGAIVGLNVDSEIVGVGDGFIVGHMDGSTVGDIVGPRDGDAVGLTDGSAVGDTVGPRDGDAVGRNDGSTVGRIVGARDGDAVGLKDGSTVGRCVGASDGDAVGLTDGSTVGRIVGASDGDAVGGAVVGRGVGLKSVTNGGLTMDAVVNPAVCRLAVNTPPLMASVRTALTVVALVCLSG